ncbi:amino acid ABC transporter substrate-binding protein [Streptomyces sp. ISL-96]|uniref:ABC transporter substrate-binding protein n=1 Tax=Streptomyces sp. ISL-96 TaxID=2819191 RepID=UPI001BE73567|nr:ABC transporter substrate-binding protein [Streptomyces sp. ISL-96]MBT2493040.1 amino acid ABC transporter substrate-binding protein [Streptomyces sp. ISL-96]
MTDWFRRVFWFTPLRKGLTVLLALATTAALSYGGYHLVNPDLSCAEGVARPEEGAECVGVSGDGYAFEVPKLNDVAKAIARENEKLKPGEYATVAVMLPLTSTDSGMRTKVLHELQGAFLQQYAANHDSNGMRPKIRLVLANTGKGNAHWRTTVDRLKAMTDGPDHLRAVSGVATSSAETKAAVKELTRAGIPVIGTTITADDIANGPGDGPDADPYPGLARVSPTNRDEARAIAEFGKVEAKRAVLVRDTRPGDHYTATLKDAFTALLPNAPYQAHLFTSPPDATEEGPTANTFRQITLLLCSSNRVDTVFFAGRHTQLRQFVNALGRRGCDNRKFTVLTGDEGSYLSGDNGPEKEALAGVSVRYAALAHPDAWKEGQRGTPKTGGTPAAFTTFTDRLAKAAADPEIGPIGKTSLTDGQAIIAYDAMATAVQGIREAAGGGEKLPEIRDVVTQWRQMNGPLKVDGASGWICLDNHGNPYNKAVPIVELAPDGTQRFVEIAWPEGRPPAQDCLPPGAS